MTLTCVTCGWTGIIAGGDLEWAPLSALSAVATHDCRPAASAIEPPPTPRPPSRASETVQRLVREHLAPDPAGVVPLDDLRSLFRDLYGRYPDSGLFSRELLRALPAGTAIRREMINGVRARRLVGMRLK